MASQINPAFPVQGNPTTASVRSNFEAARDEINDLQNDIQQLEADAVKHTPGGGIDVGGEVKGHTAHFSLLPQHADNAAAHLAGMQPGDVYRDPLGSMHVVF